MTTNKKDLSLVAKGEAKEKTCPSCGKVFICRHDNITDCWCSKSKLSPIQLKYLSDNFSDCLCCECMNKILTIK